MNNRILLLRKSLGLTQKEFGEKIGCSRNRIANIEINRVVPDDLLISHLCNVYSVNENWLKTGDGDMLLPIEEDLDYLVAKYADTLPSGMKAAIVTLLKMPPEKRKAFDEFLEEFDKLRGMKKDQD